MRIFLVDSTENYPVNPLFADAMVAERARCGRLFDEAPYYRGFRSGLRGRAWLRLTGRPMTFRALNRHFLLAAEEHRPDLVVVVKGSYIDPKAIAKLGSSGTVMANFATDDPFNRAASSRYVRGALSCYDICFSTKRAVRDDILAAGCPRVEYLPFAYKPDIHFFERARTEAERQRFTCDVAFIGGADADRVPIFAEVVDAMPGARLHLYGSYWDRFSVLRRFARGLAIGRDFRMAVSGASVAVNLVRRANRDGHVMRTFEIPACRGFMLSERTAEHVEILGSDQESTMFSDTVELIERLRHYLPRPEERESIAGAMHRGVTGCPNTYSDRWKEIVRVAATISKK